MKQILNECSKAQLWQLLDQVTQNAVVETSCLENSRSREQAYSKSSLNRWWEIVQLILKLPNRGVCLDIGTSPLTFALSNFFQDIHTLDFTDVMAERCLKALCGWHCREKRQSGSARAGKRLRLYFIP